MAKITKFWVVTKATNRSGLSDILFQKDMAGMQNQFLGGLKGSDIVGVFTTKKEAETLALKQLSKF